MRIYKFGGASVKSALSVKKLTNIVRNTDDKLIVVISAMGKTTNLLEEIASGFFSGSKDLPNLIHQLEDFHLNIINELFIDNEHPVYRKFYEFIANLRSYTEKDPSVDFDFDYDQIVSYGELLSTSIVSAYLNDIGADNSWIDIRTCLKTGNEFRNAVVDWQLTSTLLNEKFNFSNTQTYITQGFIGSTITNLTTTLGREGSDFTAAILTYLLNADEVVIWKDVPGIFNADPKYFEDVEKLDRISYQEAIELSYFGAKVIHPKTIKPLQNKRIPLLVKSFEMPTEPGTKIADFKNDVFFPPVFIIKYKQVLISVSPKDFSFIAEHNLSKIFAIFAQLRVRINLSEISAISFSATIDYDERKFQMLIDKLREEYKVLYNKDVSLITIRHYNSISIEKLTSGKKILVEQKNRMTARFVVGENI